MLAGGLVTALFVGGAGFMLGRETASPPPVLVREVPVVVPAPPPLEPEVKEPAVLDRGGLIALAARAADGTASGAGLPEDVRDAGGRRFELRLPFGCSGPAAPQSEAPMRWRHDAEEGVLRVHAAPVSWDREGFLGIQLPEGVEAIEGFWIAHPWTTSEACPPGTDQPIVAGTEAVTLPGQTLALVQFFAAEDGRQAQRGARAFTVVQRMSEPPANLAAGLRLRLRGRVSDGAGGGAVLCSQLAGPQQRPVCAISVELDDVTIEDADGVVLGGWDLGQPPARAG